MINQPDAPHAFATSGNVGRPSILLSGRFTINEAELRRRELLDILTADQGLARELVLDLDGIEAIDTAGLQLLIALRRSAARAGKSLTLAQAASGPLLEVLTAAGFLDQGGGADPASLSGDPADSFWAGRA